MKPFRILLILAVLAGCSNSEKYISRDNLSWQQRPVSSDSELTYRLFLIGDAGAPSLVQTEPTLKLLKSMLDEAGENSSAIFLGDNLYPNGLPDFTESNRLFSEERLIEQLKTVEGFKGKVFFIPGNHDWENGGVHGFETLKRQEEFIENYLGRGNTFLPDDGFPGPVEIKLVDDDDTNLGRNIRLVILDTQWWLHPHTKSKGDTGDYDLNDDGDFLNEIEDIIRKRKNDNLIFVGHHPMFSNGRHGGRFPASLHFKPPVFGSIYVLWRRFFGTKQDVHHHRYNWMIEELTKRFSLSPDLIYVAGHEHNLQYFRAKGPRADQHYFVSGSGSKQDYVASGRDFEFTNNSKGFITLQFYETHEITAEFWEPAGDGSTGTLLYRAQVRKPKTDVPEEEEIEELPDFKIESDSMKVAANPKYNRFGKFGKALMGHHNRELWAVEVNAEVFDLDKVEGGLTPVRSGGRGQSNTLHLTNPEGRKFVLRSVDKVAGKVWDERLKKTVAQEVVQDQFSVLHPYSTFPVPTLSKAAGVYYLENKLYYVPKDPRLGDFAELEGGRLALFEEKPDDDMSHLESVGRPKDVLSDIKFLREVDGDIDHRMNQRQMARSRLFDMLIADWDRHSDQWRYAAHEPEDKKGKIYEVIPRDRDVAFMRFTGPTGLLKYGPMLMFQDFRESYGILKGLNFNSIGITRRFTNQLTKEDWVSIADSIKAAITDEVIEEALRKWPKPIYEKDAARTAEVLKIRRDKLPQIAEEYYLLQSRVISVPGSHKNEEFVLEQLPDGSVKIQVYKIKKNERERVYFERIVRPDETKEVRLYGMGGEDLFTIKNTLDSGIRWKIIGGPGEDTFIEEQRGGKSNLKIFDTPTGNTWRTNKHTTEVRTSNPWINTFDTETDFQYNLMSPVLFFGGNRDDGAFFGGGAQFTNYSFKKFPASIHVIKGNIAPATGAFNIVYEGQWFTHKTNFGYALDAAVFTPSNFRNFFGLGNDTENRKEDEEFYRAQLSKFIIQPAIQLQELNNFTFRFGPKLSVTDVERDPDGFLNEPQAGIADNTFDDQWFTGLFTTMVLQDLDNLVNPRQGFKVQTSADLNFGIANTSENFARFTGDMSVFFSPTIIPQFTIANRIGAAHNVGDFPFFETNTLGGRANLRGFRSTRFSGRTSFYHNLEVRAELFSIYQYYIGGRFGVNGFIDTGRVWADGENSINWHQGYGGGFWFDFFEKAVFNFDLGVSEEDYFITYGFGFFF